MHISSAISRYLIWYDGLWFQLGGALNHIHRIPGYGRIIVITDEQSHDRVPEPQGIGYMINVASYKNGVGYGKWTHIDGFSENVIRWIYELEHYDTVM